MIVNPLSVLIAALAGFGVGALWYSPYILGERWAAIMGSPWRASSGQYKPHTAIGIEFFSTLVMAFVLANLAISLGVHGPFAALRLGFWVWLGFVATVLFSSVLFERRPMPLFYINAGGRLASLLLMSLIVGIWH